MTKREMLVHLSQINLEETISFQCNMNSFALDEEMTSRNWVKYLLTNSSKDDLKQRVDEKSDKLDPLDQGRITYLKFFYKNVLHKNNVVTAMHKFLKTFAEEGLLKTVGENESEADAQIKAVIEGLLEVNQLRVLVQVTTKTCLMPRNIF